MELRELVKKEINKRIDFYVNIVKKDWSYLAQIEEQTPEICLEAVNQNGLALKHVKNQTPDICLAAVMQCESALSYVIMQTPDICIAAVTVLGRLYVY